jgi:hypothetical protein
MVIAQRMRDYETASPVMAVYYLPHSDERVLLIIDPPSGAYLYARADVYYLRTKRGLVYEKTIARSTPEVKKSNETAGEFSRNDSVFDLFTPIFLEKFLNKHVLTASVRESGDGFTVEVPIGTQSVNQQFALSVDLDGDGRVKSFTESWSGRKHLYVYDDKPHNIVDFVRSVYPGGMGYSLLSSSEVRVSDQDWDNPETVSRLIEREILRPASSNTLRVIIKKSSSGASGSDEKSEQGKVVSGSSANEDGRLETLVIQAETPADQRIWWVIFGVACIGIGGVIAVLRRGRG